MLQDLKHSKSDQGNPMMHCWLNHLNKASKTKAKRSAWVRNEVPCDLDHAMRMVNHHDCTHAVAMGSSCRKELFCGCSVRGSR